jgi:hypothetical protein
VLSATASSSPLAADDNKDDAPSTPITINIISVDTATYTTRNVIRVDDDDDHEDEDDEGVYNTLCIFILVSYSLVCSRLRVDVWRVASRVGRFWVFTDGATTTESDERTIYYMR